MGDTGAPAHAYVVKAAELPALYFLEDAHPRPTALEWINRGTDQKLRRTTVEMLLRTLFAKVRTPSVRKLHNSAGLRASFRSERERARFSTAFAKAVQEMAREKQHLVTAIFDNPEAANRAVTILGIEGVPDDAIAMVWRASEYLSESYNPPKGYSAASVAGAITGAGVAGAVLGVGILMIPGIGPVAVAGAMASAAVGPVAAVSSVIGATGGAIAKMLTDHDVDGVSATLYEREIKKGKIFLSVNTEHEDIDPEQVRRLLDSQGGHRPAED
ncbi:hypothetical protein [Qipengyuania sphaerica]|uniref:hypothetical protein n=1 Tax=Qipengyuania sphaerica TaxID=2867243 RepID=UPI001C881763|nr:hypothetical protein [Qipengyuania sphaerica]MBX7540394.1 hypothetical protein [Qipengyuania sphaerica]